ncbi:MAG: molybdenum ABC transporter ATP-binding protein [Rhodospirillales bacterium]|nr:molybdenum ABC transporter ATP-binding protein [Rhodospirillales bacterium]
MLDVRIRRALGDFTLDVAFTGPSSGITALFGPSGSGKSTVINAIAGLLRPDIGHVRLGEATFVDTEAGIDVPLRRRRVGYVFQEARLFPHMRVRDNLLYGLRRAPKPDPRSGRSITFAHIVDLLGVGGLLDRRPRALSGGEKQRVALGRALLAQPRLLLMDEPLAALDAGRKAEILPYIERLRDDLGIPIVYVSHAVEEVARLADAVVVLAGGRVVASGDVAAVMSRLDVFPSASPFEAGAVVPVRIAGHDDAYALTTLAFDGGSLRVPRIERPVGDRLRIRVRARDVMLALNRPDGLSALNILPAIIDDVLVEEGCYASARIAVGSARLVARLTRLSAERLALRPGQTVYAVVKSVAIDGRGLGTVQHDA